MNAHAQVPPRPACPPFKGLPDLPAITRLRARDEWVAWDYVWRADRGKWDKPPLDPKTGGAGSSTNPATWASYAQAANRAAREGFAGVGFALSHDDNTTGIDLDKCRDPETGMLDEWAAEVIALAETYAEVSPSGTGVRLFADGKVEQTFLSGPGHVEVYAAGRYLTITGHHIEGTPPEIRPAPQTIALLRERVESFKARADAEREVAARQAGQHERSSGQANGSTFFAAVNSLALAQLDRWVPILFPRAQRSPLGYRVTSRSLHRDLEEDLSIARDGIKDFGLHDMGDARGGRRSAIDLVIEHGGASDAAQAAMWLCDQLGTDPAGLGWRSDREQTRAPSQEQQSSGASEDRKAPAATVWYGDEEPAPPPYLIEGVLPQKQVAILGGQSGAGKTFIGIDISVSAMTADPFIGRDVHRPGGVLWLAAEGQSEVAIRLKAAVLHRFGEDRQLPFAQQAFDVPTLSEPDALARLTALVDVTKAGLVERFSDTELVLIVIDTLASAAGFQDENSASETQKIMNVLRRLSDVSGALVLVVDHYGKMTETGVRGSSAKIGAADAILAALADKNTEGEVANRRLAVVKLRSAPTGTVTPFRLAQVKVNEWGTTHCGVEWTIQPDGGASGEPKPEKPAWSGNARILKSALERAMIAHGQDVRPWGANEGLRKAVQHEKVRAEFYASYAAESQEAKKKAFQRLSALAASKGLIASREIAGVNWLWILKEESDETKRAT